MADKLTAAERRHRETIGLLEEIRDLLLVMLPDEDDDKDGEEETAPCLHPAEARVNLSGFGDGGRHYICRECGYEHRPTQES